MTCIVALKHAGKIYMGADAAISSPCDVFTLKTSKIFLKDNMVIGIAGSARIAQIIQHQMEFSPPVVGMSDIEYIIDVFSNQVRNAANQSGAIIKEQEQEKQHASYVVGYNQNIYVVQQDWSVMELAYDYASAGAGDICAMGALYVLASTLDPQEDNEEVIKNMITIALEAASEFVVGVRGPFDILVH